MEMAGGWHPIAVWAWIAVGAILRIVASFLVAFLGVALFAVVAHGVARGATQAFDERAIEFFVTHPEWLRKPALFFTTFANGPVIAALSLLFGMFLMLWNRSWVPAVELAVVVFGGWGVIEGLKAIFARERPELRLIPEPGLSFPSGHSFFGIAFYGFLAFRLAKEAPPAIRRWIWVSVGIFGVLIASSRMLLGVHYPSDVLAGFVAGIAWLWGVMHLPNLLKRAHWKEWRGKRMEVLETSLASLKASQIRDDAIRASARALLTDPTSPWWRRALLRLALWLDAGLFWLGKRWALIGRNAFGPAVLSIVSQGVAHSADETPDPQALDLARAFRRLIWA